MSEEHKESMKGRSIGAAVVLVILVVFFLHMQGYLGYRVSPGETQLSREEISNLPTTVVTKESVEEFETVVGTVNSRKETMISSKIPAHIKEILVQPGQEVKANDLLIVLDDRDLRAKEGQAKSGLAAARAAKAQAESAYKRYQNLIKTGAATQAEFEGVEAQYQMACAKVKEAQKGLEEIRVMLGYTELRAPYSSVVVQKMAETGDLAAPGMPLLRLEDPEHLRLEIFVPESRRDTISIGKILMVQIDTLDKEIPGTVEEIVPSADPRSRSFMARITLEPQPDLRSGMFGRCYLPLAKRDMILVDSKAVYRVGQLEMVRVVTDGHLETRMVRTAQVRNGKTEILSGLEPGEKVVLMDQQEV